MAGVGAFRKTESKRFTVDLMPNAYAGGQEIVPGYTLVRRIASGMAGEVWVARASGGVRVAIKIIKNLEILGSQRELGALRVVREVKHPNLCPLFGVWFFDRDGNLFDPSDTDLMLYNDSQVMDTVCVDEVGTMDVDESANFEADRDADERLQPSQMVIAMGLGEKTLFDRLTEVQQERQQQTDASSGNDRNGIDVEELLRYLTSAASAIDELNKRHNIYHCDIKPQNILVVGGQAQVCDFGLARQVENSHQTQLAFGTPAYGAPEMLFGRMYSRTIDQYSLAVTYYHLRTGNLPFDSKTQSSFLRAKAAGELNLSGVPRAEQKVLARATQLDPDDRYEDCQTFVSEFREASRAPESTLFDSRKWAGLALVGTVPLVSA